MTNSTSGWGVNPVALAHLINGQNPYLARNWSEVREALKEAFGVVEVRQLFEAEGWDPPPRLQLFQELATATRRPILGEDIEKIAEALKHHANSKALAEKILPILLPVADAVFTPADNRRALPGFVVPGSYGDSMAAYIDRGVSYLDPVQGNALDCYFISALIALAWTRPREWAARVQATVDHNTPTAPYEFQFYNERGKKDPSIHVTRLLPQFLGVPVYARSSSAKEAWPAIFEKAYVVNRYRSKKRDREPLPHDYHLINNNMLPHEVCRTLVGGAPNAEGPYNPLPHESVYKRCDERGVTREPTMAWTWRRTSWNTREDLRALGFDRTGLVADHSYAVLGVIPKNKPNPEYVVLRDPYGWNPERHEGRKSGPWTPGDGENGVGQVELNEHGVFALKTEWFDTCFKRVGWVKRKR